MKILVIHGPNLNFLGVRETAIYGNKTLEEINNIICKEAIVLNIEIQVVQSNHEGEIVDNIQKAYQTYDGIIINAAAYTHTSVAIRDAILAVAIPTIEVHLSNTSKREDFRHVSFIAPVCIGKIEGFGHHSYILAMRAFVEILGQKI